MADDFDDSDEIEMVKPPDPSRTYSAALNWALWAIRFKNRQAALNGGTRPPLGTPRLPLD
jgi:hypothetical protein